MDLRRPHPSDDFEGVLALMQACDRAVFGDSDWTAPELREEWDRLDLEHAAWVAVEDGRLAGVMHVYDERGGRMVADGYVHPELTGRGVGNALLAAAEGRAGELAEDVPPATAVTIETAHLVGDPRAPKLLECRGYAYARTFHRMIIDLDGKLPAPSLPPGIELRPFDPDREGRRVKEALDEAFVDEWGFELRTYERWAERVLGVEQFDPSLFLVAWEGDEIAAASLNYPKRMGDWGWIGTPRPAAGAGAASGGATAEGFPPLRGAGRDGRCARRRQREPDAPRGVRAGRDAAPAGRRLAEGARRCLSSSSPVADAGIEDVDQRAIGGPARDPRRVGARRKMPARRRPRP